MSFGLHNIPAMFQWFMDRVLQPHGLYAAAYLDDVVIYSQDWEEYLAQVTVIFWSLWGAGLTANPAKCKTGMEKITSLGHTWERNRSGPFWA